MSRSCTRSGHRGQRAYSCLVAAEGLCTNAATLRYYQSTDATISSEDTQVGTAAVGALGVSGISLSQEEIDLTAPSTAGTYYYGACVDAVAGESDTTDNCTRRSVTVDVVETTIGSDLVLDRVIRDDSTREPGETFRIFVTVRNQGVEWSPATTVRFYRSTDATITTSDTEVGTERIVPLRPLAGNGRAITLTAPSTAGTYYYGACVDAVAGELDTTNNCSTSAMRVDVSEPEPGGGGGGGPQPEPEPEPEPVPALPLIGQLLLGLGLLGGGARQLYRRQRVPPEA